MPKTYNKTVGATILRANVDNYLLALEAGSTGRTQERRAVLLLHVLPFFVLPFLVVPHMLQPVVLPNEASIANFASVGPFI